MGSSRKVSTRFIRRRGNPENSMRPGSCRTCGPPSHPVDSEAFLDRLLAAAVPGSRFQVLATLRGEYFPYCLQYPPLQVAISRVGGQFNLGPPGRLALERMASGPLTDRIDTAHIARFRSGDR